MDIFLLILAIVCFLVGIAGCILPMLPGPPLSYVGMLLLHFSGYVTMSTTALIVWAVVAAVVCVIDFFITPYMTRRYGGSNGGSWGAVIGLIVGMFLPWPVGPLLGPFVGALIGEYVVGRRDFRANVRGAFGSFLSFFVGTGLKLLVSGAMMAASLVSLC